MSVPMGERMYLVTARVLVREDGPGDALIAVQDHLLSGHFIDAKVDRVKGPKPLDFSAELSENPAE